METFIVYVLANNGQQSDLACFSDNDNSNHRKVKV